MTEDNKHLAALGDALRLTAVYCRSRGTLPAEQAAKNCEMALDAILSLTARIEELEAENARLRKMAAPEWFYLAGDTSSDYCRSSPEEVIDEDWLYSNRAIGSAVVHIETATRCPDIWCAVRFFTNEEKDARQSDDAYELTEHASEEEARAALNGGGDGE